MWSVSTTVVGLYVVSLMNVTACGIEVIFPAKSAKYPKNANHSTKEMMTVGVHYCTLLIAQSNIMK